MSDAEDLLGLWDDEQEEQEKPKEKKKRTRKPKEGHPRHRVPEITIKGFKCEIATFTKMSKDKESGETREVEVKVIIDRDATSWALRVGNDTNYPASLTGIFLDLTRRGITLNGVATTDDVIEALERTKNEIVEIVAELERKVEEWDRTEMYGQVSL